MYLLLAAIGILMVIVVNRRKNWNRFGQLPMIEEDDKEEFKFL